MTGGRSRDIIAIDLLRFVCAVMVVAYHYLADFPAGRDDRIARMLANAGPLPAWWPAEAGAVGVELFFVISGMVIARSALDRRWTTFLRQRVLRLVPAAWICATMTLAALALAGQGDAASVAAWWRSVRFWPIGEQIDGSYWTLAVEISFYLVVAMAVGGQGDRRRIAWVGNAVGLASIAFWLICLTAGPGSTPMRDQAAILLLLPHGCFFALGMMIAQGRVRRPLFGALGAVALVEIAAHLGGMRETATVIVAQIVFAGGAALLVAAERLQPWLARRIHGGTARAIGLMTYPLYLLHQQVGAAMIGALMRAGVPGWLAVGTTAATVLALACIVARRAEPVVRAMLARVMTPSPRPTEARRIAAES